ncbi:tRNA dihydrouridine synthase DusB [Paenibacillus sp. FSL H7-0326]|uniref:tRNA dihydrouridine synthase DusB n=1 Tax=Paenibacillus sp. FSL H7-0326 TaxID=1921144 RepID=UPI00096C407D|nr:tRNA dihydrouridine synthase DusB [Paenibacillus sp. FSL H7-0326]OMC63201.1 tRNA dihydrouridine synthase DusB [Paenibacillus sp. FSL H7-0326]
MLKIADIEMKNQVVLAPMAGVSNPAFRLIAKEFGAGLVCAEMVSDKGILSGNKRTREMLFVDEREKPLSLQIFGGDRDSLVGAAKVVDQETNADIIDINMGCPAPKINKSDAGAKWLLDPNKIYEMVSAVVDAVAKPVTVKMRIGWDHDHVYAVENARAVESAGGKAIALHGRTREQLYTGYADWDIIKEVKESVSIPIIGNGDISSPEEAKRRLEESGVDGVMIGRAALGNPWMLYRTIEYLEKGILPPDPDAEEKIRIAILHMDRLIALKGEHVAVREMRKHLSWYLKGLKGSARIKDAIMEGTKRDEMVSVLTNFLEQLPQNDENEKAIEAEAVNADCAC